MVWQLEVSDESVVCSLRKELLDHPTLCSPTVKGNFNLALENPGVKMMLLATASLARILKGTPNGEAIGVRRAFR